MIVALVLAGLKSIGYSGLFRKIENFCYGVGMSTLTIESNDIKAQHLTISKDTLEVDLQDGRTISVPIAWYPRLMYGTSEERKNWRLIGQGDGIHWPDLDEDISVENILAGRRSGESQRSFKKWLEQRTSK
jgi:hypothetical protein